MLNQQARTSLNDLRGEKSDMRRTQKWVADRNLLRILVLPLAAALFAPLAFTQTNPGSPVVANHTTGAPAYSNAYIDASASSLDTGDFCVALTNALKQLSN